VPKTLTEAEYNATIGLISKSIEPKIEEIVATLNKILKRQGIRVGCELKWFLDSTKREKNVKPKNS
jgi:hypothetical protein